MSLATIFYAGLWLKLKSNVGICFGHQIVARALGGECVPNGGRWEVGVTPLELTDLGKEIFGVEELVRRLPPLRRALD